MKSRPLVTRSLTLTATLAAAILVIPQVFADFSQSDWRYVKSVLLPAELREEGLIELHPDVELFAGAAPGLIDLRIIDEDGSEVPYKIEVSRDERQRTPLSVSLRDNGYIPGRYTTFTADLGREGLFHNRIEFHTPTSNFRREATVETSSDAITWTRIAEQPVYDFTVSGVGRVSSDTEIRYPDATARYMRVRIADEGGGPVEVTGATVFFLKETPAREVTWPISTLKSTQDKERRATLVEIDLGTEGPPTHRMELDISDVNFYRNVSVETSSDGKTWRASGGHTAIYAFDTPKFVGDSVEVPYAQSTSRYIRLVISDEDNPPLVVNGGEVWSHERTIVVSADPTSTYSLYYGNSSGRRPSYDIERILPYLEMEDLAEATLGPQIDNPMFVPESVPQLPISERLPWLFPSVVAVAAVFVGLILFSILRKARRMLPPPSS